MKCKECNGTGKTTQLIINDCGAYTEEVVCAECGGSGEITLTNEEWLRSCSADELAGAIYEWFTLGFTRGKNGKKLNSVTEVVEWLKEIHE